MNTNQILATLAAPVVYGLSTREFHALQTPARRAWEDAINEVCMLMDLKAEDGTPRYAYVRMGEVTAYREGSSYTVNAGIAPA